MSPHLLKCKKKKTHTNSSVELPVRLYQSSTMELCYFGMFKTKVERDKWGESVLLFAGLQCRTWCVLSSSSCKSLILTVQFVLQMAAKGINCTQRIFFPSASLTADPRHHHWCWLWHQSSFYLVSMKSDYFFSRSDRNTKWWESRITWFTSKIKTLFWLIPPLSCSTSSGYFILTSPIKLNKLKL